MEKLNFIWLLILKGWKEFRNILRLLWPEKTMSSRLCFGMALVCVIAFLINAAASILYSCSLVISEIGNRSDKELKMAQLIAEEANSRPDTIMTSDLFDMIYRNGLGSDFSICLLDSSNVIVTSRNKDWKNLNINIDEMGTLSTEKVTISFTKVQDSTYCCFVDTLPDLPYRIALLQPVGTTLKPVIDIATDVSGWSLKCLLLIMGCYVVMLATLRHTSNKNHLIKDELDVAGGIQQEMLPHDFSMFPEAHGYNLHGMLTPAKEMGGDLFNFEILGDKLYFCLGDVSGKGMPAALFMSETSILFRHVMTHTSDPADMAANINDSLAKHNDSNMFCTMFIGVLDLKTNILTYCNAGHNAPVVIGADGSTSFLEVEPNLALGLFEGFPYQSQQIEFASDSTLYIYTDGVTEAESLNKKLFGDDQLLATLNGMNNIAPSAINDLIMQKLRHHSALTEQSDDITMLTISKTEVKNIFSDKN